MKIINQIRIGNKRRVRLALLLLFSCAASIDAVPFVVTTTVDNGNNGSPTPGSLRAGINAVNAAVSTAINFNIPTADPGYNAGNNTWTIQPPVDLPNIVNTVTIDGYTQPGSSVNTLAQGDNAVLTIVLNGSNYTVGDGISTGNGLHFAPLANTLVDNSVVRGLVINQWLDNGILLDTTNAPITGLSIVGCFIGTDASGTRQMANRTGIGLAGYPNFCINTIIGTPAFADRNIIAGSFGFAYFDNYFIYGSCIASEIGIKTFIQNNYIGTDKSGTIALGNSCAGVRLLDSSSTIGGSTTAERNIISGHSVAGFQFVEACENCTLQGNYIGTDITGTNPLGNGYAGILFTGTDEGVLGFGNIVTSNLISGNGSGIHLGDNFYVGIAQNTIENNLIGTDLSGSMPLPNTRFGVYICEQQNTITGNTISGNLGGGVLLYSNYCIQNILSNNFIGSDRTGTKKLPNGGNGIQIGLYSAASGPSNNTIGS